MYFPALFLVHIEDDLFTNTFRRLGILPSVRKQMEKFQGYIIAPACAPAMPDLRHNMFICGSSKDPQLRVSRGIS